jgi:hypothetical protein
MFTYHLTANSQDNNGAIVCTVVFTNGTISITDSIPAEANANTVKSTINSKLAQLQAAENFVTNLSPTDAPSSTPLM